MSYIAERLAIKNGQLVRPPKEKKPIPKISEKKKQQLKGERPEAEKLEEWFQERRKQLTGVCQCGCAEPSSKKDDTWYKASIAHIYPKAIFKSISTHPLNYVERGFWSGCHTNMDNKGMELWPGMADFDDIKAKVQILSPLLTKEEKATKFYSQLERLVNDN